MNLLELAHETLTKLCGSRYQCPPLSKFRDRENGELEVRVPGENKNANNDAAVLRIKPGTRYPYICSIKDYSTGYSDYRTLGSEHRSPPESNKGSLTSYTGAAKYSESLKTQEKAARQAISEWEKATPGQDHPYLASKNIKATNDLRTSSNGALLAPIINVAGEIRSLQRIQRNGDKRFLRGGETSACGYQIGDGPTLVFAEGVATALSIHQATRLPIVISFSAQNLKLVAESLRPQTSAKFLFAADNDRSGVGQKAAAEAAISTGGEWVVPDLIDTDFNDIAVERGEASLRRYFKPWLDRESEAQNVLKLDVENASSAHRRKS